jgi:NitT/TauT family transport system substrate-binding protein
MMFDRRRVIAATMALLAAPALAHGEVNEVVLGQQFGSVFLPAMAMEQQKMVEKHLAAAGLNDVKVTWAKLGGPATLNDGLLAGSLHFVCQGVPSMALIWDRTRGGIGVKALGAIANTNIWLNTRNPNIKSIKDFTEKDRIAMPSLRVATQAVLIQMAAEKAWGVGQHAKLDHMLVALPHPDAMAAVLNASSEITAHFATSPFHETELKAGLHTITTAYEIAGGSMTGLNFSSSEKFRSENPKVFAAVNAAYVESFAWINSDKRRAARLYIEMTREKKLTEDDLAQTYSGKDIEFTRVPNRVGEVAEFMHRVGSLKTKAQSWKDLYFPEAHELPGS